MSSIYSHARPYLTTHTDENGSTWQFAYWGSKFVYIREVFDDGTEQRIPIGGTRDDWPFVIDLAHYLQRATDATPEWLDAKSAEWISDRNEDIRNGSIT